MAASSSPPAPPPPLSLALSLSATTPHVSLPPTARVSHPAIAGRLNAAPCFSLTSFLSESPSDPEQHPLSSPPASPPHAAHLDTRHMHPPRRRRKRLSAARIARPKDAMPGFRRRRHFAPGNNKSTAFRPRSRAAPGAAAHFDRAVSAATYYNRPNPDQQAPDSAPLPDESPAPPLCPVHSEPAVLLTCRKSGANRGRLFFKCARKSHAQCDFFRWADDCVAPTSDAENEVPPVQRHSITPAPAVHTLDVDVDVDADADALPDALRRVLRRLFSHPFFRPAQEACVRRLLAARSTVALIPTGGGKSLIYQMFAALRPGIVVVITPLLSLMHDQLQALPPCLPGACLRSGQPPDVQADTERRLCSGAVKILFISPERLFSKRFARLMGAEHAPCVSLVVVDEAHCISHWSHNFRVAYMRIPLALFGANSFAPVFRQQPLVLALTATATVQTLRDVCASLHTDVQQDVVRSDSARTNLMLCVSRVRGSGNVDGKAHELVRRLKMRPFAPILGIDKEMQSTEGNKDDEDDNSAQGEDDGEPLRKKRRKVAAVKDDLNIGWGSNLNFTKRARNGKNVKRRARHTGSLIVYVTKQKDCEAVKNYLLASTLSLQGKVEMYHAGMSLKLREKVQTQFEKGSIAILVATVAFGMGLNFSNVRGVIHFDMPSSLEAYWQEVGRAGRGGEEAFCTVLYSNFDVSRTLSRSHSDGIDKSQIRQFLRTFMSRMFEWKPISQHTRAFLFEQAKCGEEEEREGEAVFSDVGAEGDEKLPKVEEECGRCILRMTEYDLNRKMDLRLETAETMCALLERELDDFWLLRPTNTKVKVRFYSQCAESLAKNRDSRLRAADRMVISAILKHGTQSNGEYCVDLGDAGFQEEHVIGSLKRLQEARHITYEFYERGLQAQCSGAGVAQVKSELETWVQRVHDRFVRMELIRGQKAQAVVQTFCKADQLLSDREQSEFVHDAMGAYLAGDVDDEAKGRSGDGELVTTASVERMKQVRRAVVGVMGEQGCGGRAARSGRQVARILHGLDSAAFRAKQWYSHCNWGRFVDVRFEEVIAVATEVATGRKKARSAGSNFTREEKQKRHAHDEDDVNSY
ncbi:unnamed protein product [Agarophyton chilense]